MTEQPTSEVRGERHVTPNFITEIIERDLREGRINRVLTRFPPEPNGYLHLGHAKAIFLNCGIARDYGGVCNLRFDDTNPTTESMEYVSATVEDIAWLGFDYRGKSLFASDYFETLYRHARTLVERGQAYVDSLSEAEIREYRGTVTTKGRNSPYRDRPAQESLSLLEDMRLGHFAEGEHVLRAKIDMAHPNMVMRDPILYRIRHRDHYRTGDAWRIYPLYDFAHGLSDAIEGVTHSLCSLEFETRRELYDWLVESLYEPPHPRQYEFGRHAIEFAVLSKRKLVQLVQEGHVSGWDDPRMPTLVGLRRRGVTPSAIRGFVNRIGVSRQNSTTSIALLEHSLRDDLNHVAPRVMAVLDPLAVTLTNLSRGHAQDLDASYWPVDVPKEGSRPLPFGRNLWIERDDFAREPPPGWRRLAPGTTVRLRHSYLVTCDEVVEDEEGGVKELLCRVHFDSLGKNPEGVSAAGTIHWVSQEHSLPAEFRLYDRLFTVPDPEAHEQPFTSFLNPQSLKVRRGFIEPSVAGDPRDRRYQFERQGYFWRDPQSVEPEGLVFNRIVTLRDSWAKRREARPEVDDSRRRQQGSKERPAPGRPAEPADPALQLDQQQLLRFQRYQRVYGLPQDDAALIAHDERLSDFFEEAANQADPRSVANWVTNDLWRELKDAPIHTLKIRPAHVAELVKLIERGTINTRIAKEVFAQVAASGEAPAELVAREGLEQLTDAAALEAVVASTIDEHRDKVEAYRAGKTGLLGFFVGQVMRETRGRADPRLVQGMVRRRLG